MYGEDFASGAKSQRELESSFLSLSLPLGIFLCQFSNCGGDSLFPLRQKMYFAKVTTLLVSEGAFLDHKVNLLIIVEVVVIVGYPNLLRRWLLLVAGVNEIPAFSQNYMSLA